MELPALGDNRIRTCEQSAAGTRTRTFQTITTMVRAVTTCAARGACAGSGVARTRFARVVIIKMFIAGIVLLTTTKW